MGRAVAVVYRGQLGEIRLRVAPLEQLAGAADRPLADDIEHGGFGFELSAARLFVHDGIGVLLLPTIAQTDPVRMRIHALRIDAGGKVEPYHP